MRRTLLLCRVALAGGATLFAVTACSGGSTDTASSSSSSTPASSAAPTTATSSAAPTTAGGDAAGFCAQARDFADTVQSSVTDTGDVADVGQQLQTLADQLRSVSAPAPIAEDWRTATSAIQQLAEAYQQTDLSDPQSIADLQQKVGPIVQQLTTAGQHIEQYLQTECGITPDSGETASSNTG